MKLKKFWFVGGAHRERGPLDQPLSTVGYVLPKWVNSYLNEFFKSNILISDYKKLFSYLEAICMLFILLQKAHEQNTFLDLCCGY